MKRYLNVICFVSVTFLSCNSDTNTSVNSDYCSNELKLLCYDSIAPFTNYELFDIRQDIWNKLDSTFTEYYCRQVKLKVKFKKDSVNFINVLLYTTNYENCDEDREPPPPFNPYVHWFHVYLNQKDTLYIRRRIAEIDSVKSELFKRYSELSQKEYKKVFISLLWDKNTDREKLRQIVADCVNGYLEIANRISFQTYNKVVCELNTLELDSISKIIPFRLRTDFYNKYDTIDFIPYTDSYFER